MSRLVQAAHRWVGTPYCHRAAVRGAGCDCLGLLRGLMHEVAGNEPHPFPPYSASWAECGAGEQLWDALRVHLNELASVTELVPGQILLFRMRETAAARHLGILSRHSATEASFIHAYERHGVIESPLSRPWKRRIVARFEMCCG